MLWDLENKLINPWSFKGRVVTHHQAHQTLRIHDLPSEELQPFLEQHEHRQAML
jgi:hypothetical protein